MEALYKEGTGGDYVQVAARPEGSADPLVPIDQSQRLYDALKVAGIEATFIKMENEGHGFRGKDAQEKFMSETRSFFDKHLRPEG